MNDWTLLFVDDEPNALSSLKRVLHNKPYRALFAEGAQSALGLLKKETVEVVITDLKMPRTTGSNCSKRLRSGILILFGWFCPDRWIASLF